MWILGKKRKKKNILVEKLGFECFQGNPLISKRYHGEQKMPPTRAISLPSTNFFFSPLFPLFLGTNQLIQQHNM